jgi:hypothetical protein
MLEAEQDVDEAIKFKLSMSAIQKAQAASKKATEEFKK